MRDDLTRRLWKLRERLLATNPTRPESGMLPLDEYEAKTIDEQRLLFDMFWNPETHAYDPEDFWRESSDPTAAKNPRGNSVILGVFFVNDETQQHLFEQKRLFNPLGVSITRVQWRIILSPLLQRDANWCWLPSIIKAHANGDWRLFSCCGWNCYDELIYKRKRGDWVVGPTLNMPAADYKGKEWTGTYLLRDLITEPLSRLDA